MSRLNAKWLKGLITNLHGTEEDDLQPAKLLVVRNGIILSEGVGRDYLYDGTNIEFLINVGQRDVILLIDPSIGACRRLQGGYNYVVEEPEAPPILEALVDNIPFKDEAKTVVEEDPEEVIQESIDPEATDYRDEPGKPYFPSTKEDYDAAEEADSKL